MKNYFSVALSFVAFFSYIGVSEAFFNPGTAVEVFSKTEGSINVRAAYSRSGLIVGEQRAHTKGIIVSGPIPADGVSWYQVDYATGADGWSYEGGLIPVKDLTAGADYKNPTDSPLTQFTIPDLNLPVFAYPTKAWDIDKNGIVDANKDGTLIVNFLLGFHESALIKNGFGSGALRTSATEIEAYLTALQNKGALDADGNGKSEALVDGILINRYLTMVVGPTLVDGAVGTGATRTTSDSIVTFLNSITAPVVFTPTPVPTPTPMMNPYISGTDSTGLVTPGVNIVVNGKNFAPGSYIKFDGTLSITPYYSSTTSLSFKLPSNVTVGFHTVQVRDNSSSLVSNTVLITVVAPTPTPTPAPTPSVISFTIAPSIVITSKNTYDVNYSLKNTTESSRVSFSVGCQTGLTIQKYNRDRYNLTNFLCGDYDSNPTNGPFASIGQTTTLVFTNTTSKPITTSVTLSAINMTSVTKSVTIPPNTASEPVYIPAIPSRVWDIDASDTNDVAKDARIISSYLYGFRGAALIQNGFDSGALRTAASDIEYYLSQLEREGSLDADGNGKSEASDGVLIARYMSKTVGPNLINEAVGRGATRTTSDAIVTFLNTVKTPTVDLPSKEFGAIDSITNEAYPLVKGYAIGINSVGFSISGQYGDKVYGSGTIKVENTRWSHKISENLQVGNYTLVLYANNKEIARRAFSISKVKEVTPTPPITIPPNEGTPILISSCLDLTQDLSIGQRSASVISLKQFLKDRGYITTVNLTNYFGAYTQGAVRRYQVDSGISPALGYVGPRTRARIYEESCASSDENSDITLGDVTDGNDSSDSHLVVSDVSADANYGTMFLTFEITSSDGDLYIKKGNAVRGASSTAAVAYNIKNLGNNTVTMRGAVSISYDIEGADDVGAYFRLNEGEKYEMTVTIDSYNPIVSGTYYLQLLSIGYASSAVKATNNVATDDSDEYSSDSVTI